MTRRQSPKDRWRRGQLARLTEEEKTWFHAIHGIGIGEKEAHELAQTAARRQLWLSDLTQLKESHKGLALFGQVREWIRGRPRRASPQFSPRPGPRTPTDLRRE